MNYLQEVRNAQRAAYGTMKGNIKFDVVKDEVVIGYINLPSNWSSLSPVFLRGIVIRTKKPARLHSGKIIL